MRERDTQPARHSRYPMMGPAVRIPAKNFQWHPYSPGGAQKRERRSQKEDAYESGAAAAAVAQSVAGRPPALVPSPASIGVVQLPPRTRHQQDGGEENKHPIRTHSRLYRNHHGSRPSHYHQIIKAGSSSSPLPPEGEREREGESAI